jgi:general secretion pathway protein J
MPRPDSSESGFTLFEILVGLAVSSLILVGMSLAMKTINMGYDSATNSIGRQGGLAAGLAIIAGDISRIQRAVDDPVKPTRFLFSGRSNSVTYIMEERPGNNKAGLYWVRLAVRDTANGSELVRSRAPFVIGQSDTSSSAWTDDVAVLRGDFAIGLSYRATRNDLRSWVDDWQNPILLPDEIRITMTDVRTGRLRVPGFVQALKISAEVGCVALTQTGCTINSRGRIAAGSSPQ